MAGIRRADVDVVEPYDCYTITVALTLEDSGFCANGEGMSFVRDHDLTYRGDFPVTTHGGQLGYGQASLASGFSQLIEGVRQVRGERGDRQVRGCDIAFVTGTGGNRTTVAGTAVLHTFTVTRQPIHPAFADETPQVQAIVTLDGCGVRMTSTLVEVEAGAVQVGQPLTPVFDLGGDGITLLRFRPAPERMPAPG